MIEVNHISPLFTYYLFEQSRVAPCHVRDFAPNQVEAAHEWPHNRQRETMYQGHSSSKQIFLYEPIITYRIQRSGPRSRMHYYDGILERLATTFYYMYDAGINDPKRVMRLDLITVGIDLWQDLEAPDTSEMQCPWLTQSHPLLVFFSLAI